MPPAGAPSQPGGSLGAGKLTMRVISSCALVERELSASCKVTTTSLGRIAPSLDWSHSSAQSFRASSQHWILNSCTFLASTRGWARSYSSFCGSTNRGLWCRTSCFSESTEKDEYDRD